MSTVNEGPKDFDFIVVGGKPPHFLPFCFVDY